MISTRQNLDMQSWNDVRSTPVVDIMHPGEFVEAQYIVAQVNLSRFKGEESCLLCKSPKHDINITPNTGFKFSGSCFLAFQPDRSECKCMLKVLISVFGEVGSKFYWFSKF